MKRRVFLITLLPLLLVLGLFLAIKMALAETAIPATGTSCLSGAAVSPTTVTDTEKATFGDKSVAYNVTSAQSKPFKLIIGVSEVSHSGSGGTVSFTYGFKNLWSGNYGSSSDGTILLAKWAPGETPTTRMGLDPFSWGVSANHFLVFDHRNVVTPPQGYWSKTLQMNVADYSSYNIRAHMLNGGGDGLAHQQVCINNAINLVAAFPPEIPPVVDQASSKSNLQIIRQTYNPVSSEPYATYERGNKVHVVLSVYSPSSTLSNIAVTDFLSAVKVDSVKNIKYTLSDGSAGVVNSTSDYRTQTIQFSLDQILQGENKIEYDYEVAN